MIDKFFDFICEYDNIVKVINVMKTIGFYIGMMTVSFALASLAFCCAYTLFAVDETVCGVLSVLLGIAIFLACMIGAVAERTHTR